MFAKTFEYIILLLCSVNCYVFKTNRCKNSDAILSCFLAFKIITNILTCGGWNYFPRLSFPFSIIDYLCYFGNKVNCSC